MPWSNQLADDLGNAAQRRTVTQHRAEVVGSLDPVLKRDHARIGSEQWAHRPSRLLNLPYFDAENDSVYLTQSGRIAAGRERSQGEISVHALDLEPARRECIQLRPPRDPDDVGPGARETGTEIPSRPANTIDRDAQSAADRGFRHVAGLTHAVSAVEECGDIGFHSHQRGLIEVHHVAGIVILHRDV